MSVARQLADAVSQGELTATASIKMWTKSAIPTGWLECDGSAVSRTTYADLFTEIGTSFGVGDGSTTFNLPNLQDNVPVGKSATKALGSTGGSASVTPTLTDNIAVNKTGSASGNMNGAPDAGTLAVSVSGNITTSAHTLSTSEMPSHGHDLPAYNPGNGQTSYRLQGPTTVTETHEVAEPTGGGGSHSHNATHNLTGNMTGAPGLGTLGVTINDNIAVSKSGSVTSGSVSTLQPYQAVIFIIKT